MMNQIQMFMFELCVAKSCNEAESFILICRFQLVPNEKKSFWCFFVLNEISYHFLVVIVQVIISGQM